MPDNLALRMRPKTIDQVIGQEHLVGSGKIIRRMVEANRLSSMILLAHQGLARPVLLLPSRARLSMPFGPSMQPSTAKNACKRSQRKLSFRWLGPAFG